VAAGAAAAPAAAGRAARRRLRASSRTSATRIPAPAEDSPDGPLSDQPRILILSASIGEGHDLPARLLAEALRERGASVAIHDTLAIFGWPMGDAFLQASPFHSELGNRIFDVEFFFGSVWLPGRRFVQRGMYLLGGGRMRRSLAHARPDLIVSVFPAATEVLGQMRQRGQLGVPVVSGITDLSALQFWSHPGVDLHLIIHPESEEEVRGFAPDSRIETVTGLYDDKFLEPRDRIEARRDLGLPTEPRIVLVSGGGWGVGDLQGAIDVALDLPDTFVVALCGRNEDVRAALDARFASDERVRIEGFTTEMSDYMAAADALVHSTAGLTVLEAILRGCAPISYGWGRAHIRINNRAYVRHGLAQVAANPTELRATLTEALAHRPEPDASFAALPSAASVVLDMIGSS
jgi:processive 1,2-diacylglycerol beta-glucosyltransferase